jgi:hypothetical protein
MAVAMNAIVATPTSHRPMVLRAPAIPSDAALNCRTPAKDIELSAAIQKRNRRQGKDRPAA